MSETKKERPEHASGKELCWHVKGAEEVCVDLDTTRQGLAPGEAAKRLVEFGPNRLEEKKRRSPLKMFFDQFRDFMIIILVVAAVVAGALGEVTDTVAIVVIVILNAVLGFSQEFRAEKAMEALKKMAAPSALVIRGGITASIDAAEIVPGDLVVIEAGNIIPADLRLIEAVRLKIDEAALTGESVPVEKYTAKLDNEELGIADRLNMAYRSTVATYGRGMGLVIGTGMNTEIGKIATMLQEEEEVKTPLQRKLEVFGKRLAIAILMICGIIFSVGLLRGEPALEMLLTAIALAVAAIPEALPAVVTITLAIGARKMVKQNALIRKLPAVETLGSVTYICSDKTGTLTMNKMAVEDVYVDGRVICTRDWGKKNKGNGGLPVEAEDLFLIALALNNDASTIENGEMIGDPTETALLSLAEQRGYIKSELEARYPRVQEIPFESERKRMTTLHKWGDGYISFTKGAADMMVEHSKHMLEEGEYTGIDIDDINAVNDEMASDGLRVLGVAIRKWESMPERLEPDHVETDMVFVGLAGMMDPPRDEAKDAVAECRSAGIRPVMITGDHQITARAIAERLDIIEEGSKQVLRGVELAAMPMDEFQSRVEDIKVYARVAPEQKLKIVKALQDKYNFVAMTGDGVNDAPALKRSDIGIAMGITGTDVSKEASHMILLDDNFATIVKAVKEGRRIFDNIRKFIRYLLTTNAGEVLTLFLAPFFGLPLPLLPIHILWINLMTDGLPAVALSVEPEEGDVMARPPRDPREGIFSNGLGYQVLWVGLLMAGITIGLQSWAIDSGIEHWQTMVFTVLCFLQLGNVMALRSERSSLYKLGLFSNIPLLLSVIASIMFQLAIIYIPFLNPVFRTQPLSIKELVLVALLSLIVFIAVETEKWIRRVRAG
ncbi:MAG: cation-translocating P-type ATPase [Nitrospirota bacterium]|nr:MAG: cation-translocating P-type ATPase [Nitrospirota bacterium]